jgi:hypothetical protein
MWSASLAEIPLHDCVGLFAERLPTATNTMPYGTAVEDRPISGSDPAATHQDPAATYDNVTPQEVAAVSVRRVRLTYAALLIVGFILGVVVKTEGFEWIAKWAIHNGCTDPGCIGAQSCYRISFAMAVFFAIHWAVSSPWNLCLSPAQKVSFNQIGIFFKLLSLIPLFLVSFAIPNDFFVVYAWLCLVLSVIFLIGQLLVLLEFSYAWSDDWATREESKYTNGLLVCTVFLFLAGVTFTALSYVYFGSSSSCQTNQAMISITLVCALMYSGLSIVAPRGSILPSTVVYLYTAYTCFSAMSMVPGGECNTLGANGTTTLIVSTVISGISLAYMTVSAGESRSAFQIEAVEETVEEAEAGSFAFFHVQMLLGSCYLAMLITNWTVVGSDSLATLQSTDYEAPMWAKLGSEFVCILLYVWTLIAPIVCKDRNFS